MKSRQATISVDAMLEVLQRSAEEKEKKLEEEDEALIKSLFGVPREVLRRIDDDILDNDEDLSQISTENAETSNNNSKRRKVSEDLPTKPADYLTKTSYNSKNEENKGDAQAPGDGKFIFKSEFLLLGNHHQPPTAMDRQNMRSTKQRFLALD
ncbi:hypothetical protein ACSBR1_028506 [Camellia fascicularis]